MFNESNGAVTFAVRVVPRSSQNQIVGIESSVAKIRLTAPPVDGKANAALIKFLAELLDVSLAQIEIISGERSKQKIVRVRGMSAAQIQQKLAG